MTDQSETPDAPPAAWARHQQHVYAQGEDRPLGSFLVLMRAYGALTGGLFGAVRYSGRSLPERLGADDLALVTVATHKIARLAAKDPVTSPLRAPFTTFAGTSGEAELAEEVRGTGPREVPAPRGRGRRLLRRGGSLTAGVLPRRHSAGEARRVEEATRRLDRLCAALPRLLSEEVDPATGSLLGNTPLVPAAPSWPVRPTSWTPPDGGSSGG